MSINYITPTTRVIRVSLDGLLMNSGELKNASPISADSYEVQEDSDNWF